MTNSTPLNDLRKQLTAAMDIYKDAYASADEKQRKTLERHYKWHWQILASLRYA